MKKNIIYSHKIINYLVCLFIIIKILSIKYKYLTQTSRKNAFVFAHRSFSFQMFIAYSIYFSIYVLQQNSIIDEYPYYKRMALEFGSYINWYTLSINLFISLCIFCLQQQWLYWVAIKSFRKKTVHDQQEKLKNI